MRAAAGEKVIEMQEADQIENTCGDLECLRPIGGNDRRGSPAAGFGCGRGVGAS